MTTPEPAPIAYLDPVHNELDRLRTENATLRDGIEHQKVRADSAELREMAALRCADTEQARVDQLTDELALTRDTLRLRSDAVNTVGATNDTLRATLARIERTVWAWPAYTTSDRSDYGRGVAQCREAMLATLADQEPARD